MVAAFAPRRISAEGFGPGIEEKIDRLIDTYGVTGLAGLVGVAKSQPTRWRQGRERPSAPVVKRLLDLDYLSSRLSEVLTAPQAQVWLSSANPHLNGSTPAGVLISFGGPAVEPAVSALEVGAVVQDAMLLHRVSPVDPGAAQGEPYHPGYVPSSSRAHRIDNPEMYDTLYLSGSAAGAVAEAFGAMAVWGDYLTEHPRGFTRRLATFELGDRPVLDLDDPAALVHRSISPSRVVTRDRSTTQQWAAAAFAERAWVGVSWWSYYDPEWTSLGLWCRPSEGAIDSLISRTPRRSAPATRRWRPPSRRS